jgi:hypothetical protein
VTDIQGMYQKPLLSTLLTLISMPILWPGNSATMSTFTVQTDAVFELTKALENAFTTDPH